MVCVHLMFDDSFLLFLSSCQHLIFKSYAANSSPEINELVYDVCEDTPVGMLKKILTFFLNMFVICLFCPFSFNICFHVVVLQVNRDLL